MSEAFKKQSVFQKSAVVYALLAGALALSGCGKQAYEVTASSAAQQAPGTFKIQPKVDIVLIENDTGSMDEAFAQVQQQLPAFLQQLDATGWDYHFAAMPLTMNSPISHAIAAKFDGNWGSQWTAPYPGAPQSNPENLLSSLFTIPDAAYDNVGLLTYYNLNGENGFEPGFQNIFAESQGNLITSNNQPTNIIRPDAMLAVLLLSNKDDTSFVNYCYRSDGFAVPCDSGQVGSVPICTNPFPANYLTGIQAYPPPPSVCGNSESSYQYYKTLIAQMKPDPAQMKFYSAVSTFNNYGGSCLGGNARYGARYKRLAADLNGQSYDVCSQGVSGVLTDLANNLQAQSENFETHYLFINAAPDPTTINVTKYLTGDVNQPIVLPQDPNDGWTYAGYLANVYAIDSPIPMNLSSGYAIELHGAAKLQGSDTAKVTFTAAGAQNSTN